MCVLALYSVCLCNISSNTNTHIHPCNGPLSVTTQVSRYQKGITNLETVSGSGISWAICKSAPRSRQITTPAPHHSSFFTGQMPFLPPNQQHQGNIIKAYQVIHSDIDIDQPVYIYEFTSLSKCVSCLRKVTVHYATLYYCLCCTCHLLQQIIPLTRHHCKQQSMITASVVT